MHKKLVLLLFLVVMSSFVVEAKQRLVGTSAGFHQPSALGFVQKPFEDVGNGFDKRKSLLDNFPQITDLRVRKIDISKVTLIRALLLQTLDKKFYTAPDYLTLGCAGKYLFDKDRSMIAPLVDLACIRDAQIPNLRNVGLGTNPFLTGSAVRNFGNKLGSNRVTGRAVASGILGTSYADCNEKLKLIAYDTLNGLLESERSLVSSELELSTCGSLTIARQMFKRGDSHLSSLRFASAINSYEDAWRKTVSCVCSSLG